MAPQPNLVAAYFYKYRFIGTVTTETVWPSKPDIITNSPFFLEKVGRLLYFIRDVILPFWVSLFTLLKL